MTTNWWEEINASFGWHDGMYSTLSALFALVSSVALVQTVRIQLRVPDYGWTIQKVFHVMNFIGFGVWAVVFGLHKQVFILNPKVLRLILLDLPGLLLFSAYTLLILFWAEIYHQAKHLSTDKLRLYYVLINAGIYIIQVYIWIDKGAVQFVGRIFIAVVSIVAALGFFNYGVRLFTFLRKFPVQSMARSKKLFEVGAVMTICVTSSIMRCLLALLSAFKADASLDAADQPIMDPFYYMLVEILPSALVLFINRKLPPKRVSA